MSYKFDENGKVIEQEPEVAGSVTEDQLAQSYASKLPILPSSERFKQLMAEKAAGRRIKPKDEAYPWLELPVGASFPVARDRVKLKTLENYAWRMGRKLGREFGVLDHGEGDYEVGRIK